MKRLAALVLVATVAATACSAGSDRVVVAAGTTLVDSGFLEAVVDAYAEDTGFDDISVVGRSSLEAVALARSGDADVIITHEPSVLAAFLEEQPESSVVEPFASRFIVVAPAGWSQGEADAVAAFRSVAERRSPFVSRDDGSGTHARELAIWSLAGIDPSLEPWYVRAGAGMGATLLVAADREAITLAELGAFLSAGERGSLVEVPLGDAAGLENPYVATVPASVGNARATSFQQWLVSDRGREAILDANEALFGFQVYSVP